MNTIEFEHLMSVVEGKLSQNKAEWKNFLCFCQSYCREHSIENPIVVEIGIWNGVQRLFYEWLLKAEWIGIDNGKPWKPTTTKIIPTIYGDSHDQKTVDKLKILLMDRPIDILFIDGDHTYEGAKKDYDLYSPLTQHLVVFHDVSNPEYGVYKLWKELLQQPDIKLLLTYNSVPENGGIGIIVKEGVL